MTTPLWCLIGFVVWTLILLTGIGASRVAQVASGSKQPNEFPAGVPHGGDAYWRLNRAHQNCLENLPLFATVVLVATLAGIKVPMLDTYCRLLLGARIGQSLAHLSSSGNLAVNVRFTFFLVQIGCLIGMIRLIAAAG